MVGSGDPGVDILHTVCIETGSGSAIWFLERRKELNMCKKKKITHVEFIVNTL
jgi:hypothetical protein